MAAKPRSDRETVMTMRLPRELHTRVKASAEAGDRGFAEEVRRLVELSLAAPGAESAPVTRRLLNAVALAAEEITRAYGPWDFDQGAAPQMQAALRGIADQLWLGGDEKPRTSPKAGTLAAALARAHPTDDPATSIGSQAAFQEGFGY